MKDGEVIASAVQNMQCINREGVNGHSRNLALPELRRVIVHPHEIDVPHGETPFPPHVVEKAKKFRVGILGPDGCGTRTDTIQVHHCPNLACLFRIELFHVESGPLPVVFFSCEADKDERMLTQGTSKSLEEAGKQG